jgi:hypothetical protein
VYEVNNLLFFYDLGYRLRWVEPCEEVAVTTKTYYKKDEIMACRSGLAKFQSEIKTWDADNTRYEKYLKDTSDIENRVYGNIKEAHERKAFRERTIERFEFYYKLAENNIDIAINFFVNAFKNHDFESLYDVYSVISEKYGISMTTLQEKQDAK